MLSQIEQNQEKKDERGNQLTTSLQNKFSQYPELMEVASGSSTSRCEAFINRPTGKVLLEALDFAQLQFSKDFEAFCLVINNSILMIEWVALTRKLVEC